MTKKELMIKAHKMTNGIKNEYPEVDYKFQLGLCLAYLQNEGENEMVELKGTEKQIKWAEDIRKATVDAMKEVVRVREEEHNVKGRKITARKLVESKERLEVLENEESSKYFIDNFAFILKNIKDYEIEAKHSEVSIEIAIGWAVEDRFSRI